MGKGSSLLSPFQNKNYVWWNFSQISPSNWNVAKNNVNVVANELPSQITIYTCLTIDIWTRKCRRPSTRFGAIRPKWWAFSEIGVKSFRLYYGHPWLIKKRLVRAMQCTRFLAKIAKNDLKPIDFLKCDFYLETEGVLRADIDAIIYKDFAGFWESLWGFSA